MNGRAVHFEEIDVRRVRGIRHGEGFKLSGLSPGVNLIHGPNGAGKSTTAVVIQELLWSGRTGLERPTVAGRFRDGDAGWWISIDAGHAETTCDGQGGTLPELGPPENRHRYHVALHELIGDENSDFAKVIADASQGGYDLQAAATALGFTNRPTSRRKQAGLLKGCRDTLDDAKRAQMSVVQDEARLPELRGQHKRAADAERIIDLHEKARDCIDAEDRCRRTKSHLDDLPEGVAQLHGDEREKLDQLAGRRESLENERKTERKRIEHAERELAEVALPDKGFDKDLIVQLRSRQRRLHELQIELRRKREQSSMASAEAEKARDKLGDQFTDDQLAMIETVEIGELSAFARGVDQNRARQQVLEERCRLLDREAPAEISERSAPQIRDAINALGKWLATPAPAAKGKPHSWWPNLIAAALIAALGVLLAILQQQWLWLLIVAVAVGVAAWDWWLRQAPRDIVTVDKRSVHRESFAETDLPAPSAWEAEAVSELLHHLLQLAVTRAHEDERLRQLGELRPRTEKNEKRRRELDRQRQDLEARLGVRVEIADDWLPLLVDNLGLWQRSSAEAAGAKQVLVDGEQERRTLLDGINELLRPFGYNEVDSAEASVQSIDDLDDRRSRHAKAVAETTDANRRIDQTIEPGLQETVAQRHRILERIGIAESDESIIDEWLALRPNYLDLKTKLAEAETIRSDRRQALAGHEHLLDLDRGEIESRIEQQQEIAGQRDTLTKEITRIEDAVKTKSGGHELSDALAARDAAKAALAEARNQSGASVVGDLLTKWVRTVAVERSRPQVFRRANELVVKFTRGTLRLELDDRASPPCFRARLGSEPPRPVDQLSTGERVQLLTAVRVAFLEQDEPTRLPLLLDETLGTADDFRAGVMIDTIIDIAREGRQVFYFTAQHDEVGKWIARLEACGAPYKVLDLAEIRQMGAAAAAPIEIAAVDVPRPLAPDGMTHDEYGRSLGVPNIDPTAANLDGLHLWHLIDDVHLLYELLCQQITTWGQLRTLLDCGGAGLVNADAAQFDRAATAAKAIEAACRAWQVGRAKQVDRRALQDSGHMTDSFIDAVTDLATRVGGDARAIIQALQNREVSRWKKKGTEGLHAFFEKNGYYSTETLLQPEEIRVRVQAAVADDLRQLCIDAPFVERIVASLPAPSAVSTASKTGSSGPRSR